MASTYTTNSGIEKIGTGEQSGSWGNTTNINFDIIDRAMSGVGTITLSGTTHTLTTSDGSASEGHYKVLILGGSPSGTNTITISPNDQTKFYAVYNSSGQTAVFTQGSGGNATVLNGEYALIFADGAGAGAAVNMMTFGANQLANNSVTTAKIVNDAVTSDKIATDAVTSDGIAADAVGASELANDAVVDANVASGAAIAFSKMENLTASRALVSDGSGDVSVSDVTATEIGYLDGVTSNIQTQIDAIAGYPQVITVLTSGTSYSIPSGAQALLIRASGAGGGGAVRDAGNASSDGGTGGATTVSNATLGITISASGGLGGQQPEGNSNNYNQMAVSTTGTTIKAKGAQGSRAHGDNGDRSPYNGLNGHLVQQYITGPSVGGETLTYSLGSGGTGGSAAGEVAQDGQDGYIELWVW